MESVDSKRGSMAMLILSVLRDGSLHGYQIAREIERRSEGYFECKEGTLYPVLHKLERDGLLVSEWQAAGEQRRRRYYALTPLGARHLAGVAAEWRQFAGKLLTMIDGVQ